MWVGIKKTPIENKAKAVIIVEVEIITEKFILCYMVPRFDLIGWMFP